MTDTVHLLYLDPTGERIIRVDCPGGDDRDCRPYREVDWPDDVTCRCTIDDCACREGDHWACYGDFGETDDAPGCLCLPTDGCYARVIAEEGISVFDGTLPPDENPVRVRLVYDFGPDCWCLVSVEASA